MARYTANRPDPPGWRRIGPACDQFPFWIDPVGAVSFTLVLFICFTPSHPCVFQEEVTTPALGSIRSL